MHITLSAYQLNSWTDLLEKLLPAALAIASQEDVEFRQVLGFLYKSLLTELDTRLLTVSSHFKLLIYVINIVVFKAEKKFPHNCL